MCLNEALLRMAVLAAPAEPEPAPAAYAVAKRAFGLDRRVIHKRVDSIAGGCISSVNNDFGVSFGRSQPHHVSSGLDLHASMQDAGERLVGRQGLPVQEQLPVGRLCDYFQDTALHPCPVTRLDDGVLFSDS